MFKAIKSIFGAGGIEKKSAGFPATAHRSFAQMPVLIQEALFGGRIGPYKAAQIYQSSSAVATAVDMISGEFSNIDPVIYDRKEKKYIDDHPVLDALQSANSDHGYSQFIDDLGHYFLLNGAAYVGMIGAVDKRVSIPLQFWAADNQEVTPNESGVDQYPNTYYVSESPARGSYQREGDLVWRFIERARMKEIVAINRFSSRRNKTQGDSPLEAAILEVRQQISARTHNLSLLENGGRPSSVWNLKDSTVTDDDEKFERVKESIQEQFSGPRNAGKIAVVSAEDMDITELGINNKDMDFQALDDISQRAIYMRYKVPLALVTTDAMTLNNYEVALTAFYDQAVIPNIKILLNGIGKILMLRAGMDAQRFHVTYNPDTIRPLMMRRLLEIEKRRGIGLETTNELREFLPGREPIEGGDVLYQSTTLAPLGEGPIEAPEPFDLSAPIGDIPDEVDPAPVDPQDG